MILTDVLSFVLPALTVLGIITTISRRRPSSVRHGVIGSAHVVSVDTRNRLADSPQGFCTMNLVVSGPGIQPTAVLYEQSIFTHTWPEPEMELPCVFDPKKIKDVVIDWDAIPDPAELARKRAYELQQRMRGVAVAATEPVTNPASPAGTVVASLEQLADLRDRGEVSESEYAVQKQHILYSMQSGG
ncbi:MAG: hypothetical protein JWQ19_2265 [Subtercola sp.]|nr:hypothetical protein [Subtercola sp.]